MQNRLTAVFFLFAFAAARADEVTPAYDRIPAAVERQVDFVRDVQPIFIDRCFECHSTGNVEAGVNLAVKALALQGGDSGPILQPGNALRSPLVQLVSGVDPDRLMPPEGDPLSREQIAVLRAWVDQGAAWPEHADISDPRLARAKLHWAFQRLPTEPPVVPAKAGVWPRSSIDQFVAQRLKENGLRPTREMDPRRLVRRIYFALVGLPPTPDQTEEFISAATRDRMAAVAELTDRLLASHHYGERWARHWLDVARYADSDGQEADRDRPQAYHYRDFVIRAWNEDLPFDTFIRWQIAGDEFEPKNEQAVVATGFLTAGPHTQLEDSFLEEERLRNRYNELDDVVSTLGVAMMGLTIGCARCHDHKFEAISSADYYRLLSAFHSGDRKKGKLPSGDDGLYFDDHNAVVQPTWIFRRADFYDREIEVSLGFPQILTAGTDANEYWRQVQAKAGETDSTMQRRALANWLTDVDHGAGALVARVIVNRIWQHHFGRGLVRTESDFGVRGESPTHPELLEWLAYDLVANGWKIKRLQRQIIRSATWQQDISFDQSKAEIDPSNRLLWRRRPQRLEAEVIRDAMLAISGTLNSQMFGPGFKPPIPSEAVVARNLQDGGYPADAKDTPETRRRSIYMFHKRVVPYPMFQAFDRPDLLQSCARRQDTTVAPQALALLNDTFVRKLAGEFATRLAESCGSDNVLLVVRSFEESLGRAPTETERMAACEFIASQEEVRSQRGDKLPRQEAITDYCQSIFGLNEFIYVD